MSTPSTNPEQGKEQGPAAGNAKAPGQELAAPVTNPEPSDPAATTQVATQKAAEPPAAPPPPSKPADKFDVFAPIRSRIVELCGEQWFQREASFLVQVIGSSEFMQRTTIASRVQVLMQLANTGLTLDPVKKFAYVVPRNVKSKTAQGDKWETRAVLEPSYMGLIKVANDCGAVKVMRAEVVYEGDDIDIEKGTNVHVKHIPYWKTKRPKGEVIAAYSVAVLHDGTTDVLEMGREELDKVKATSEAVKNNRASPYDNWESEMQRKAVIRRHLKTLPKSDRNAALFHAVAADEEQFGSIVAEASRAAAQLGEGRSLRLELAEALDNYMGADREELRAQIQAKIEAKEFTADYGERMLAHVRAGGKG